MSQRYKGGVISATPPTLVAGAGASGTWTLEQQMQATAAGLWPVNGPFYIEDVFSTYLYTGNGSTQTITNGIDLSTNGGLVWTKGRSNAYNNTLVDTARGVSKSLVSDLTAAQDVASGYYVTAFNTNGFSVGLGTGSNGSGATYVSWTFREQPKFFDVVTYTGDGNNNRLISHNLGSTPGCVIVKCTSHADTWAVWHRSLTSTQYSMALNTTAAQGNAQANQSFSFDGSVSMSSTQFVVSQEAGYANSSDKTYVAYLFAHNAGGFGLTGTDNVISCGSYTVDASQTQVNVNLGYEPQWVLIKRTDSSTGGAWYMFDNMRGIATNGDDSYLLANTSGAEVGGTVDAINLTSTGFQTGANATVLQPSATYIYIAIRRGPMKVPTSGTSVFAPVFRTTTTPNFVTNFVVDSSIYDYRPGGTGIPAWTSRLLGGNGEVTSSTGTEVGLFGTDGYAFNNGVGTGSSASTDVITWNVQRAPGFHDVVCYTGNSTIRTINHNLGVAPELMIVKKRSAIAAWPVYLSATTLAYLNLTDAQYTGVSQWNSTAPTSTVFTVATSTEVNESGQTYVAYLFATCAGVSKVGSYTGTGTTKQIDCGFTGGSRFVMIKRTDSTGDWYVWDSARGIVAGNDPYLLLNSTAAEVTNTDYVDTYSAGFEISSTAPAAINASGGTFIFLAIA